MRNSTFESDRRHVLHPFAEFPQFLDQGSRVFDRAEGVHVYGADGRKYLDGIGGLWCVNIGYGRQEMADAIAAQVTRLPYYNTFTDMTTDPAAQLAQKLADLSPDGLNNVFFTTGGSMSVDSAVRLAHYYFQADGRPEKKKIIARENAYHGSTFLAASITGIKSNHARFHTLATGADPLVRYVACPHMYRKPEELTEGEYCDQLIEELEAKIEAIGAEHIACFFAEPIMGAGGVIVAPHGYHRRALEVCHAHDILYVSDEVVTAFGRLGHMFASQDVYDIVPDMIITAKGISSGYLPLGATIFSDKIKRGISNARTGDGVFSHGFTYSGHPVSCVAGLKNIEIMEREGLCDHVREVGPYFEERLRSLSDLEIVGDVRGSHFMMAIEFVSSKSKKSNFDAEVAIGKRVASAAYERGMIARNVGDYIILSPPLILSKSQIDWAIETLRAAILDATEGLTVEKLWSMERV